MSTQGPANLPASIAPERSDGMISPAGRGTTTAPSRRKTSPVAQPLIGFDARNFLGEQAPHLRAGVAAHERLEAETGAQLIPKRLTAPVIDPRVDFVSCESERHVAE